MANNDTEICMTFRNMVVQMVEINKMQSARLYIYIIAIFQNGKVGVAYGG